MDSEGWRINDEVVILCFEDLQFSLYAPPPTVDQHLPDDQGSIPCEGTHRGDDANGHAVHSPATTYPALHPASQSAPGAPQVPGSRGCQSGWLPPRPPLGCAGGGWGA
jgi:hypothetical protein